jgi:hypothetical protein
MFLESLKEIKDSKNRNKCKNLTTGKLDTNLKS